MMFYACSSTVMLERKPSQKMEDGDCKKKQQVKMHIYKNVGSMVVFTFHMFHFEICMGFLLDLC